MHRGVAAAAVIALLLPLAGCATPDDVLPWTQRLSGPALDSAPWSPGWFWTYHATFRSGRSIDVALVVHEAAEDGFRLGTNLTAGFFGLPFNGTVNRGLNPIVSGQEWRLYEFPLVAGERWSYDLFGHTVTTRVRGATIDVPGAPAHPGFALETEAYGRTFARYDYSPLTGWFTRLTLIEPTDGAVVLDVALTGFGRDFGHAYWIETPVASIRHHYPAVEGPDALRLPAGARLTAELVLEGAVGGFLARFVSPGGVVLLEEAVHGRGVSSGRATFVGAPGSFRLEHLGLGQGDLRLDITAVVRADGAAGAAPDAGIALDLAGILGGLPAGYRGPAPAAPSPFDAVG